jgi:tRNA uridine 5-carbamoylmethylation protein Kti12
MDITRFRNLDCILVCGLPAAGKSEFAKEYFQGTGWDRVSRKEIHRMLYEMIHFGKKWSEEHFDALDDFLVKHVERKIIEHLLQNRQKVLIDTTSVSAASRKNYVSIARNMRKSIGVIFINTKTLTCLERNREKEDPIPEKVIAALSASIELPTREEGFKEVLVINE